MSVLNFKTKVERTFEAMAFDRVVEILRSEPDQILIADNLIGASQIEREDAPLYNRIREEIKRSGKVALKLFDQKIAEQQSIFRAEQKAAAKAEWSQAQQSKIKSAEGGKRHNTVNDYLCEAPGDAGSLLVPTGYGLSESGTTKIRFQTLPDGNSVPVEDPLAVAPCLVTGITKDIDSGRQGVRLAWLQRGTWRYLIVDRKVICNGQLLIEETADFGFPVCSSNRNELSEYLLAFVALNEGQLFETSTTSHCGWIGDRGFLIGSRLIKADGEICAPATIETAIDSNQQVVFRSVSVGHDAIARAYTSKGDFELWKETIGQNAIGYPIPMFGLYAAFVPPLLDILDVQNFIIDLSGMTSSGKTTSQRIAASVWGNPKEDTRDSAIIGWDNTPVAIERNAAARSGLPLILNDTKTMRAELRGERLQTLLYNFSEGRGRARGERGNDALANTVTWRSVMLSSGEAKLTSLCAERGGVMMRVIALCGKPFGNQTSNKDAFIKGINADLCDNYGFAGPAFVSWLLGHKEDWPEWKMRYRAKTRDLAKSYQGEKAGRLAGAVAAVEIAAEMAHSALDLPWKLSEINPIPALWPLIAAESEDTTGADRALSLLASWVISNDHTFKRTGETRPTPTAGWTGTHWEETPEEIRIFPHRLEAILKTLGFDLPESVIGEWFEAGYLVPPKGVRGMKSRRYFEGTKQPFYVIAQKALFPVENEEN